MWVNKYDETIAFVLDEYFIEWLKERHIYFNKLPKEELDKLFKQFIESEG